MSLSAPNAITSIAVSTIKTALAAYIPTVAGNVPATIADGFVNLTEGGEPPPMAPEWFVGVHKDPTSVNQPQPGGRTTYTDEVFTLLVTISMKVTRYASDRVAKDGYPLLQDKIRVIASYFANNAYTIMNNINGQLDLTATNGFIEPFVSANMSPAIQKRGKSWFKAGSSRASDKGGTQGPGTLAVSATMRFEGLRRIQVVGGVN